jgi:ribosomal protein L29
MVPGHKIQQQIRLLHLKTQAATGQLPPILQMAAIPRTQQQIQLLHLKTRAATGQLPLTLQIVPGHRIPH